MRELIGAIPDGRYSFEDWLDECGDECGPIKVAVDIDVAGEEITVDFSRSSDQVPVALNSYINYTRAYTLFAVKVFTDALLPQNGGVIRPIHVRAREGSFFNPREPAPSGGRAIIQIRIFEVINGALAKALPDKAFAAFSHWSNPNIGGINEGTGKPFVMYDLMFGGYGAREGYDGAEALSPVVNCANIPVEVHETINPVLVRRFELMPDTGGAGRWRGGCGIRKDIELRSDKAVMTLLGRATLPQGLRPVRRRARQPRRDGPQPRRQCRAHGLQGRAPARQGRRGELPPQRRRRLRLAPRALPRGDRAGRRRRLRLPRSRAAHLRLARLILTRRARQRAARETRSAAGAPHPTARAARRRDCATA